MSACAKCSFDPDATIAASWTFHVPRAVKSGNARINNVGGSRFAYARDRKGWQADMLAMRIALRIPVATSKRRVTLTRVYGKRCRDFDRDNLAAGTKSAIDGMVLAGLLVGDAPSQAEIHFAQLKGDKPGLLVTIEVLA